MGDDRFTGIENELKGYRSLLDRGVCDEKELEEGVDRMFLPDERALFMQKENSQADALVDRLIVYKWEGFSWRRYQCEWEASLAGLRDIHASVSSAVCAFRSLVMVCTCRGGDLCCPSKVWKKGSVLRPVGLTWTPVRCEVGPDSVT